MSTYFLNIFSIFRSTPWNLLDEAFN